MNTLEILLSKRWILKAKEKDLYYEVKDELGGLKEFLIEKLGYQIIVNPYLIKVEKIPAHPAAWMGIMDFKEKLDYIFLCYVLMFLEDKENEEQFVLSELTEYVQSQCREVAVDWTVYQMRRCLIRVLKYCEQNGMLLVDDGSGEDFSKDYTTEVLYENTGASRYFVRNFTRDISGYHSPGDFQKQEWIDVNEDRGVVRRQRVYRTLMMSMGMLRTEDTEEDFAYVKNYRNMLQNDLSKYLDCELQVFKGSAYLILGADSRLGRRFPEDKSLSDMALLCFGMIRQRYADKENCLRANEEMILGREELVKLLEECKAEYGSGFIKSYRELTTTEFVNEVWDYLEELSIISTQGQTVRVQPIVGKVIGKYPERFVQMQEGEKQEHEK